MKGNEKHSDEHQEIIKSLDNHNRNLEEILREFRK